MASGLRAAGVGAGGQAGANLDIQDLPGPIRLIVRAAYGDSFGTLFLIAAVFAVVTLITVVMVKEVPLRTTIELKPQPVADVTDHPAEHVAENAQMATTAGPASAPSDSDRAALDVLNAAHEEARQVTTLARNEAENSVQKPRPRSPPI